MATSDFFDPKTNQWGRLPDLATGRHGTGFAIVDNQLFTAAGSANRGGGPEQTSIEKLVLANANIAVAGQQIDVNRPIELSFVGLDTSEMAQVNPFTDYRLMVTFKNGDQTKTIRGFYAADGDAANSGADKGNIWKCRFAPSTPGTWTYDARLQRGPWIAIDDAANPKGVENIQISNASGTFQALANASPEKNSGSANAAVDLSHRDYYQRGRLRQRGRYFVTANGEPWIKFGANSPENLLAYVGFDGTYRIGAQNRSGEASVKSNIHRYAPHTDDWQAGDPQWRDGRGREIVGMMNYLADTGMNSVYFLTMNIGGDGKDVWPYRSHEDVTRFDCSKLDQWNILFSHMQRRGLALHVITQETENELMLDGGDVGRQRKLYYLELISRFAHHPAIVWNVGEESGASGWKTKKGQRSNTAPQRQAIVDYLRAADPYENLVLLHSHSQLEDQKPILNPLLGRDSLDGISLQVHDPKHVHRDVSYWVSASAKTDNPWILSMDEIGPADRGAPPDATQPDQATMRRVMYDALLGGAGGVEWYFGYKLAHNDLNAEDWRSRQELWRQNLVAQKLFQSIDVTVLDPQDGFVDGKDAHCLANDGSLAVIYAPADLETVSFSASTFTPGDYVLQSWNPVTGVVDFAPIELKASQPTVLVKPSANLDAVFVLRKSKKQSADSKETVPKP
ncbi:MAG: DUF5060 domain-containing protein [Planctomycetota bacterium]